MIIAEVSRRSVELFSSRILSETKITLRDLRNELTGKIFEISIKYNKKNLFVFYHLYSATSKKLEETKSALTRALNRM